jgi:hypothetical protein
MKMLVRKTLFSALTLLWCAGVYGQAKPVVKSTAKPVTPAVATTSATTTPAATTPATTTPAKTVIPATTLASADIAPLVKNMDDYIKTPAYAKRKAKYDKSTPAPVVKKYTFPDNSKLSITLDKNLPSGQLPGPPVAKNAGSTKKESSGGYDCTVTPVVLTANSNSFLNNDYSGSMANIVPGLCYTYANLTDGSWNKTEGNRYMTALSCDEPNMNGKS